MQEERTLLLQPFTLIVILIAITTLIHHRQIFFVRIAQWRTDCQLSCY